jgi:hypothetical protein
MISSAHLIKKKMPRKICSVENCTNQAQKFGKCRLHGPKCSKEGCQNAVYKNNLCQRHNPILKCKLCDKVIVFGKLKLCRTHGPRCNHPGCENSVREYGKCATYSPNRCKIEGCSRSIYKEKLCRQRLLCPCNKLLVT